MSISQHRRRSGIALGAAGLAMAGSVMMASPASAHTPRWSVTCDSVTVSLKYYSKQGGNTVTLTAGDKTLKSATFKDHWGVKELALPAHTQPLTVHLVVKAVDTTAQKSYDLDQTKSSPVCEGQVTKPTPVASPSVKPSPSESAAPEPSQSSSAPAVKPVDDKSPAPSEDLAETGASSATPLIAGIAAAVVIVGAGLVMLARKRRSSQA